MGIPPRDHVTFTPSEENEFLERHRETILSIAPKAVNHYHKREYYATYSKDVKTGP
jgi:hypothetical protein